MSESSVSAEDMIYPMPVEETVTTIACADDIVVARQRGRALAAELGFSTCDQTMIATAISELARNILEYATRGHIAMTLARTDERLGVVIEARDEGPGIANLDQALEEGCSAATGLGFGLAGVRRLMDEFDIASEIGKGTKVTAKKWQMAAERS
jgi:serine/threonine-protein kinase RsbT